MKRRTIKKHEHMSHIAKFPSIHKGIRVYVCDITFNEGLIFSSHPINKKVERSFPMTMRQAEMYRREMARIRKEHNL